MALGDVMGGEHRPQLVEAVVWRMQRGGWGSKKGGMQGISYPKSKPRAARSVLCQARSRRWMSR